MDLKCEKRFLHWPRDGQLPATQFAPIYSESGKLESGKVGGLARDVLAARGGNVVVASEEKSVRVMPSLIVWYEARGVEETQEVAAPPPPPRPQSSVLWQPPQARGFSRILELPFLHHWNDVGKLRLFHETPRSLHSHAASVMG